MSPLAGIPVNKEWKILIYAAFALMCIRFFGDPYSLNIDRLNEFINSGTSARFNAIIWWSLISFAFYAAIPLLILWVTGESVREYGLQKPRGNNRIYLYIFLLILPLVIAASYSEAFQNKYPFYKSPVNEPLWPRFIIWECCYFLQFAGLEFFFRGLLVHGLKNTMGSHAIGVSVIPYAMIHFQKPLPEAFGSIVAGLILGYLSFKKGSVIPGIILHFAVALLMDILSLWHTSQPLRLFE